MIIKCKKGIKKNSEQGDGHKDGTEILIYATIPVPEEVNTAIVEEKGLPKQDYIHFVFFPEDKQVDLPIVIAGSKIEITSEEIVEYEISEEVEEYLNFLHLDFLDRVPDVEYYK